FQRPPDLQEVPAFIVRQRRVRHAKESMAPELHRIAESVRSAGDLLRWIEARHRMVETVDVLPHLARDAVADGARILPRLGDALHDGVGIVAAKGEKLIHRLRIGFGVKLEEALLLARHDDEGVPAQPVWRRRLFQQHVIVHVENPRGVLGSLHVTRQPEQRIRDARQHYVAQESSRRTQVSLLPPPWEEFTTSEPGCSATRVKPPGTIVTFCPSYRQ